MLLLRVSNFNMKWLIQLREGKINKQESESFFFAKAFKIFMREIVHFCGIVRHSSCLLCEAMKQKLPL
jgi:hypothetical protein